jgi:uncharacterized membrane protein YidH (DUF202 family)
MTVRQIVGAILVIVGIAAFAWGGVFWTREKKVIDAGPLEVTTHEREGIKLPPVLGGLALVGGVVLLLVPERRRT